MWLKQNLKLKVSATDCTYRYKIVGHFFAQLIFRVLSLKSCGHFLDLVSRSLSFIAMLEKLIFSIKIGYSNLQGPQLYGVGLSIRPFHIEVL